MYGGAGKDVFVLNADNIATLSAGVTNGQLSRVDGGTGLDQIKVDGANITLDLTAISNVGASTPDGYSRINSVEKIDLTGSGDNILKLSAKDIQDMAGMNLWSSPPFVRPYHQLMVDGDVGDTIQITDKAQWTLSGTTTENGVAYDYWTNVLACTDLLVKTSVAVM